ncbi:MAG: hypothetical protein SPL12_09185 [Bacteroidales bacterium]|nr:hypothetical protein [Bacteroidales bacterium]
MGKKILLLGPKMSGKTTMLVSYGGRTKKGVATTIAPPGTTETDEVSRRHGFLWRKKTNVKEVGGNDINIRQFDSIIGNKINAIGNNGIVLYVFNGIEFLNQVRSPSQGGEIYAIWLHLSHIGHRKNWPQLNRPHFVATHADQCDDMKQLILDAIETANSEYLKLVPIGSARYDRAIFSGPFFHCIDATNPKQVRELINSL